MIIYLLAFSLLFCCVFQSYKLQHCSLRCTSSLKDRLSVFKKITNCAFLFLISQGVVYLNSYFYFPMSVFRFPSNSVEPQQRRGALQRRLLTLRSFLLVPSPPSERGEGSGAGGPQGSSASPGAAGFGGDQYEALAPSRSPAESLAHLGQTYLGNGWLWPPLYTTCLGYYRIKSPIRGAQGHLCASSAVKPPRCLASRPSPPGSSPHGN